jgi:CRP-like cAMP-binding protein
VDLELHQIVHFPGDNITHLYFPLSCLISVTVSLQEGQTVETAAIGNREAGGLNAFMGGHETTQTEYVVQVPGRALRIKAQPLREEFDRNTEFRSAMLNYTQAFIAQLSQNVACNRIHRIEARLARWLMEVRDRVRSERFELTQEFIAQMITANRVSVVQALGALRDDGIINTSRSFIQLADIDRLSERSCECYDVLQREYDRLLGAYYSKYSGTVALVAGDLIQA